MDKVEFPGPIFRARMYLVTKGVPYDVAEHMHEQEVRGHVVAFARFEGWAWDESADGWVGVKPMPPSLEFLPLHPDESEVTEE